MNKPSAPSQDSEDRQDEVMYAKWRDSSTIKDPTRSWCELMRLIKMVREEAISKHEDENSWLEFMSKTELAPIDRVNFMKDRIEEEVEQARQECEKEKELLQEASYKCGKRVARATAISEVRELLKINLDTGALEAHNIKILDEFDKKFKQEFKR